MRAARAELDFVDSAAAVVYEAASESAAVVRVVSRAAPGVAAPVVAALGLANLTCFRVSAKLGRSL